jgi:hypothetical protein
MKKFKELLNKPALKGEAVDKAVKIGYGLGIACLCVGVALVIIDKVGDK